MSISSGQIPQSRNTEIKFINVHYSIYTAKLLSRKVASTHPAAQEN